MISLVEKFAEIRAEQIGHWLGDSGTFREFYPGGCRCASMRATAALASVTGAAGKKQRKQAMKGSMEPLGR